MIYMKKNTRIITMASAALLAVAPMVANSVSVNAANTTQTNTQANNATLADQLTPKAYFTYNGQKIENGSVLPVGNGLPVRNGMTVKELLDEAKKGLSLESNIKTATTQWHTDARSVILNLIQQGVKVNGNDENATIELGSVTSFKLNISATAENSGSNGVKYDSPMQTVFVPFNSNVDSLSDPAIMGQFTHDGKTEEINANGQAFQVAANSKFDPTDIKLTDGNTVKIVGQQSSSDSKSVKVEVVSNPVDTSQVGKGFTVKLAATNSSGKKTEISYQVFVRPEGQFQLNILPKNWVGGLEDQVLFYQGEKYYIGTDLVFSNGEFFSTVSKASVPVGNRGNHIATKYLANSDTSAPDLVKKTIMHKAKAYTRGGGSTRKVYSAFTQVYVNNDPVHFESQYYANGDFYQVYNADGTYTNYFVKIGNIDGTKRTLKKNAYVYATSKRRADRTVLKKGQTVTTYGGSYKFKNGKRYYRIEGATATNKRYVKVANFK